MMKFKLYEKRRYRRIPLEDDEGVYCIVSRSGSSKKTVTVPAAEFSQKGFKFSVPQATNADFQQDQKLYLKAIAGSRNLTFAEPISFEVKWQDTDLKKNRTYVGCKIDKITTESEEQFITFIGNELKFAGQWGQDLPNELPPNERSVDQQVGSETGASLNSQLEKEGRLEGLFENNHAVMLVIDPETANVVDANRAAVNYYGWSHEEITSKKISDINTLSESEVRKEMARAKSLRRRRFLFRHRLANGDVRDVEVYSGPIQLHGRHYLFSIVHDVTERIIAEQERDKLINRLKAALDEIKTLKGLLPFCSHCDKIREDSGHWEKADVYLHKHSQADMSHSVCPECAQKHYPGLDRT